MRLKMRAGLSDLPPPTADPFARPITPGDADALAGLMLSAYRGTPDDAGEGPAEALAEVRRLFAGEYGAMDWIASEVVGRDGGLASATVVTEYRGQPLIAFSMTAPAWKRRGLARGGLVRALHRLRESGRDEAWLAVTASNVAAVDLYRSIGFREAP